MTIIAQATAMVAFVLLGSPSGARAVAGPPCIDKAVPNAIETVGMDVYSSLPENFLNIDNQSGDSVRVTMDPDVFPGATAISVHYAVDVNTENCDVTTAFDGLVTYDAFCYALDGQPKFTEISIVVRFGENPSIEDCETYNPPPGDSDDTVYFSFEVPCTSTPSICETGSPTAGPTSGPTAGPTSGPTAGPTVYDNIPLPECVPDDSLSTPGSEYCPDDSGVTALHVTGASSLPENVNILWDIQGSSNSEAASVQFQVQNPFPASTTMFVKYQEPAGVAGASTAAACDEHELGLCGGTTSAPITAHCLQGDGNPFTLVHVYFADSTNRLNDQIFGPVKIDECCYPEDVPSENVALYSFLIRCSCPTAAPTKAPTAAPTSSPTEPRIIRVSARVGVAPGSSAVGPAPGGRRTRPPRGRRAGRRLRSVRDDYSFEEAEDSHHHEFDAAAMVAMWEEEHEQL